MALTDLLIEYRKIHSWKPNDIPIIITIINSHELENNPTINLIVPKSRFLGEDKRLQVQQNVEKLEM